MKWKLLAALAALPVALAAAFFVFKFFHTPDYDGLKAQGEKIVQQVEAYRITHGFYPVSCADAHIRQPLTLYGYWHYERLADGTFQLHLGHYGHDGFELRYRPGDGWYLDT